MKMNRATRDQWQFRNPVLAVVLLCCMPAAFAQTPNEVIEGAVAELDQQLSGRRDELAHDKDALYALIDGILLPRFDRRLAAQQVLAKHWRTATDEQKERFVAAFYSVLLRTYADGVLEFDASKIEILEFRGDLTKRSVVVKTIVRLDDGTKVPVNYRLANREAGWLIFDISIEGISYVHNYRTELGAEISGSSVDAVIERLESQVESADSE